MNWDIWEQQRKHWLKLMRYHDQQSWKDDLLAGALLIALILILSVI
jgi:hypothetical protein